MSSVFPSTESFGNSKLWLDAISQNAWDTGKTKAAEDRWS